MSVRYPFLSVVFIALSFSGRATGSAVDILQVKDVYLQDSSFRHFPFEVFSAEAGIGDVRRLEQERQALNQRGYDGDLFVERYLEYFMAQDTLSFDNPDYVSGLLSLGETFWLAGPILGDSTLLYEKLGDRIFNDVSVFIQNGIGAGELDGHYTDVVYWTGVLARHQYHLNIPVSDMEKGVAHLKNGNYGYVMKRVWTDHKGKITAAVVLGLIANILLLFVAHRYFCIRKNK